MFETPKINPNERKEDEIDPIMENMELIANWAFAEEKSLVGTPARAGSLEDNVRSTLVDRIREHLIISGEKDIENTDVERRYGPAIDYALREVLDKNTQ